jgi:hypothetical protein
MQIEANPLHAKQREEDLEREKLKKISVMAVLAVGKGVWSQIKLLLFYSCLWATARGLSWLTNSALVYEPKCGGEGVPRSQPMSTAVHMEPK